MSLASFENDDMVVWRSGQSMRANILWRSLEHLDLGSARRQSDRMISAWVHRGCLAALHHVRLTLPATMTGRFCSIFRGIQLFNSLGQIHPLLRGFTKTGLAIGTIGPLGQDLALRCPLTVKFSSRRHVVTAFS
jgi:hypothetical protein